MALTMFKLAIYLGLATLATAQWAFTVPDGDLGKLAPLNNVQQGDIHNFKWQVGLANEPVKVLTDDGHASLWITSGLDQSFYRLLAGTHNPCLSANSTHTTHRRCRLLNRRLMGLGHRHPFRRCHRKVQGSLRLPHRTARGIRLCGLRLEHHLRSLVG